MIWKFSDKQIEDILERLKVLEKRVGHPNQKEEKYEFFPVGDPYEIIIRKATGLFKTIEELENKKWPK